MTSRARATTAGRKPVKSQLSLPTQKALQKLLLCIAKGEQDNELKRQFIASNESFEPYTVF